MTPVRRLELHRIEREWLSPLEESERQDFLRLLARWGSRVPPVRSSRDR